MKAKKLLSLLLLIAMTISMFVPVQAADTSGKIGDNVTWNFDTSTGTVTISGNGTTYNYGNREEAPGKDIDKLNVEKLVIEEGVTELGDYSCSNFALFDPAIYIPKSVIKFGRVSLSFPQTDIYYGGTQGDWEKIEKPYSSYGADATIHFNSYSTSSSAQTIKNISQAPTGSVNTSVSSNGIKVYIDNEIVSFGVQPRLVGGRTMVPLRAIFEGLGATVDWNGDTQTVTAYNEVTIVSATIGQYTMTVNGTKKTMDVAPMVIDNRTLVPARFVAEAFDCDVEWDGNTQTVYITTKTETNPTDIGTEIQESKVESASRQLIARNYNFTPSSTYMLDFSQHNSLPYDVSISNGKIFYSLANSTSVFVYDGVTSKEFDLGGIIYNMLASGNKLYYIDSSQCVCVLDIATGITQELCEIPDKIERKFGIPAKSYTAAMELNNGILYVTLGESTNYNNTEFYTYNININDGKVGQPTINKGRPSIDSHSGRREYSAKKLYAADGKTVLDSGLLHFCAKDADKTVYIKFEGKNQNLSEYERELTQNIGYTFYAKMSLYVVNNDGTNKKLIAQATPGGESQISNSSSVSDFSGGTNIEPKKSCGICGGSGKITCDICGGSGRVSEYDRLTHEKVDKTCRRTGCYGGQIDCPGC